MTPLRGSFFVSYILQVFQANTDSNTAVVSNFPETVFARVVRITCLTKQDSHFTLRFELLGCLDSD